MLWGNKDVCVYGVSRMSVSAVVPRHRLTGSAYE